MKQETASKAVTSVGVFAAIAASLCCITPLLAILAGASGIASAFSWLEPARPYLIVVGIGALGFGWYKALKLKATDNCADDSCAVEKKSFLASKSFLAIITIVAILLMAFPYYGKVLYPKQQRNNVVIVESDNIQTANFNLKGMTCESCESAVNSELSKVNGVIETKTSYAKGTTTIKFDKSKTSIEQLKKAISQTGYKLTNYELLNK